LLTLTPLFFVSNKLTNKRKIINDPVHGFIEIASELIFDLIEHPAFQRLRRIKQLGLTNFVYPGATHNRFQHALGATHLMKSGIEIIRQKGHEISKEESEAALLAILLHDIGHSPFSHALEFSIIRGITHEDMSSVFLDKLNRQYKGALDTALKVFNGNCNKKFLHQLVSGQLDMDRLDYLKRDSFFTGVTEGVIGSDRIIKMLNVYDDKLVVDAKGIYSIEKFLIARRLMYWQVYFHKTVVAAEYLLMMVLKRARELALAGEHLFSTPPLEFFLKNRIERSHLNKNSERLDDIVHFYTLLDDDDIMSSAKTWTNHSDKVLSKLAGNLVNRQLFRIKIQKEPFPEDEIELIRKKVMEKEGFDRYEASYFVFSDEISNHAYSGMDEKICILQKNGKLADITEASDMMNISMLSKKVKKHFICFPKEIEIF